MCSDFLYNACLKHFSFQEEFNEIFSQMRKRIHLKYSKYPLLFLDFNDTWIFFPTRSSKYIQISIFMKIRPMGDKLFHADGQTDMTKLISAFRIFVNAPRNGRDTLIGIVTKQPATKIRGSNPGSR